MKEHHMDMEGAVVSDPDSEDRPPLHWYVRTCMEDSVEWFGEETFKNLMHQTLALCGEAGELANLVKKLDRGDKPFDEAFRQELALEITDVFIYTMNLVALFQLDLHEVFVYKRDFNEQRFGNREGWLYDDEDEGRSHHPAGQGQEVDSDPEGDEDTGHGGGSDDE